jgi:hypothetical protein
MNMKTRCFSRGNENQGVHVEFSVRRPSPPNTYSYVPKETWIQQENLYEIT